MRCFLILLFFSFSSCGSVTEKDNLLITINTDYSDCSDYFIVSKEVEKDVIFNELLASYLYKSMVGGLDCDFDNDKINDLYVRDSFIRTILLFYDDEAYKSLNHYEKDSRWIESYDNLLFNCGNILIRNTIADSLLYRNKSNGLQSLWISGLNIESMSNYNSYVNWVIENEKPYKLSELIVILHNANEIDERDRLLKSLSRFQKFNKELIILRSLIENFKSIKYELYIEEIFGGI